MTHPANTSARPDHSQDDDEGIVDYSPIADGATVGTPSSPTAPARGEAGQGQGMEGGKTGRSPGGGRSQQAPPVDAPQGPGTPAAGAD